MEHGAHAQALNSTQVIIHKWKRKHFKHQFAYRNFPLSLDFTNK